MKAKNDEQNKTQNPLPCRINLKQKNSIKIQIKKKVKYRATSKCSIALEYRI